MTSRSARIAAGLGAAIIVAACAGGASESVLDFRPAQVDFPLIGNPPTPDPPVDPSKPQPQMTQSAAFVDAVEVVTAPGVVEVKITGQLPTPCHRLQLEAAPPDPDGVIRVEVWSVANAEQICIQVPEPFAGSVVIDELDNRSFTIMVSGVPVGVVESNSANSS